MIADSVQSQTSDANSISERSGGEADLKIDDVS
jgi:hypothetical protein